MASTYIKRDLSVSETIYKWTWSAWVKRSGSFNTVNTLFKSRQDGNNWVQVYFGDGGHADELLVASYKNGGYHYTYSTSKKFRDVNAWYHIVVNVDSSQSTAGDRVRIYVNGERETSFANSTNNLSNGDSLIFNTSDSGTGHTIGSWNAGSYFDGSMSHVHYSSGYSYAPTVFGSTDSTTGEWKINTAPSFTLGGNGYTVLKDGNTITDQSSNSNDFTVGGGTLTKTEDCPSNVFATYNNLNSLGSHNALSNGNTTQKQTSGVGQRQAICNIGNITGKFYAEFKMINLGPQDGSSPYCGVSSMDNYVYNTYLGNNGIAMHPGGNVYKSASVIDNQTSITYTTNNIVSVALDITNNKCHFRVNGGTWLASGDPANNTGGYDISSLNTGDALTFATSVYNNNCQWSANFGNGYFGTTAVSSAGTNASGIGIFEYDVPTGYTALSTKGLNS
jgi:hypothetical protein|tara:strand:+ start:666 stop:2009 length:1344 start_codon:yes stop_codon:yes gene_type:complete